MVRIERRFASVGYRTPENSATVPEYSATFDALGPGPRVVTIGLNADETPGPVAR